jgi:hypothetical protein
VRVAARDNEAGSRLPDVQLPGAIHVAGEDALEVDVIPGQDGTDQRVLDLDVDPAHQPRQRGDRAAMLRLLLRARHPLSAERGLFRLQRCDHRAPLKS